MKQIEKILQYAVGGIIIIGFFALLYGLLKNPVPQGNNEMLNIVVGALIGSFTTIVGYYYGSSKGSSDKNEIMHGK